MSVITTGNHPKALWPGIKAWFGLSYGKHPIEWSRIFDEQTSDKAYEEEVEATGFGLAPVKAEGASISYDTHTQGPTTRYTNVVYGLGFIVTEEEEDDNQYEKLARSRAESLAFSMRTTKEIVHANVLNRAFAGSGYLGGDGKTLVATDHPTVDGSQSNALATAADFSEAALEDIIIQIGQAKNTRGHPIALVGQSLVIPVPLQFEATRVLKSTLRSGSAENDTNAVREMGMLPGGVVVNHYLTDADAWFIKTNAPRGLQSFKRKALAFAKDSDFDTSNKKHKATERYVPGWSDWRGLFGMPGS